MGLELNFKFRERVQTFLFSGGYATLAKSLLFLTCQTEMIVPVPALLQISFSF